MGKFTPAVFAVGDMYQIMVRVDEESLMWVKVGDLTFYDDSNGILRSATTIHRMTVPAHILDEAKSYTICERKIIERKPYFSETENVTETTYSFKPVTKENVRTYHIADAHNLILPPVKAAEAYGDIDFLILNGDVIDHSGDIKNFDSIYDICDKLTHGNIPVVFSRGNHDLRGIYAENIADYTPTDNGKSYFTFRLGSVWGIVLDCGEDKPDTDSAYGNTICCHAFRERETEFIKNVIENAPNEFMADGVKTRLVISHNPFARIYKEPFNIEHEIFSEWCKLLKENVKPDIMICGHLHKLEFDEPDSEKNFTEAPCVVAIASKVDYKTYYAGGGFEFNEKSIKVTLTDSNAKVLEERIFSKKRL